MITYAEMEQRFHELENDEINHIDSYTHYLLNHKNDNKFDYISSVFVSDSYLNGKNIATLSHDRFSPPNYHSHRFMEITYILDGDFVNIIEGQEILMHKGDVCILPPMIYHSIDLVERDIKKRKNSFAINIFIRASCIAEYFSGIKNESFEKFINGIVNETSHRKFAFFVCRDPSVSEHIAKLLYYTTNNCTAENKKETSVLSDNLARSLIAEMLNPERYTLTFSSSFSGNSYSANDIIGYISANFKDVTLDDIAKKFNYSFSYTSKLIKQRTGLGFSKMISDIRLEKAGELLESTEYQVQDIATMCGYNNIEHFHRSFRAKFGMTPLTYRESHTKQ